MMMHDIESLCVYEVGNEIEFGINQPGLSGLEAESLELTISCL